MGKAECRLESAAKSIAMVVPLIGGDLIRRLTWSQAENLPIRSSFQEETVTRKATLVSGITLVTVPCVRISSGQAMPMQARSCWPLSVVTLGIGLLRSFTA